MEIMAIGNLNLAQNIPAASEAEMPGMFGSTLQSALENIARVNFNKNLGKDKLGYALIANLISNSLPLGISPEQDVPNWMDELIGSDVNLKDLFGGAENLEALTQEIVTLLSDTQAAQDVPENELFETVFQVVKEIQEYTVHQETIVKQLEQDAPSMIAGEMRVIETEETKELTQTVTTAQQSKDAKTEENVVTKFAPVGAETKLEHDVHLVFEQVQTENVVSSVLDRIETALDNGNKQLFIRLQPEVLGGLAMKLSMTDKGLVAKIVASSQETQTILNTNVSTLENSLKDKGIQVASVEISYNAMNDDTRKQESSGDGRQGKQQHRVLNLSTIDYEDTNSLMEIYELMMADGEEEASYQA